MAEWQGRLEGLVSARVNPSRAFWSGKRVLVTGHTGFKGSWLAFWLEAMGASVVGLSLAPETEPSLWKALGRPGGTHLGRIVGFADIRDADAVAVAFETSPEIVLHLAAQALVHPSYERPADTFATNVVGLCNVLDAARATPSVRAVVNVTSDKCYENVEQVWAYREDERMGGSDPYSASKGCAELVTASYRRSFFNRENGPRLASARAGNVIGGGDWSRDRLLPDCVRAWQRSEAVVIRNPLASRPWQHVLEPLAGYLVLAEALFERGADVAEGWNFGPHDADAWPVGRVVERSAALWGDGAGWRRDCDTWPHEAMLLRVDAAKARHRLGWQPRLTVTEALAWTIGWYKAAAAGTLARTLTLDQISSYEARSEPEA